MQRTIPFAQRFVRALRSFEVYACGVRAGRAAVRDLHQAVTIPNQPIRSRGGLPIRRVTPPPRPPLLAPLRFPDLINHASSACDRAPAFAIARR
jgi:hypothetical protein